MNHESQRKAIAKALGWENVGPLGRSLEQYHLVGLSPKGDPLFPVPDYPNDLNAMYEAEEWLRGKELPNMGGYPSTDAWRWYQNYLMGECPDLEVFHAKADQRARAFLKLLKLWEETPASLDSENERGLATAPEDSEPN